MSCAVVCGVGGVARAFEHMNRNGILHIYASYHIKSRYIRYRIDHLRAVPGAGRSAGRWAVCGAGAGGHKIKNNPSEFINVIGDVERNLD